MGNRRTAQESAEYIAEQVVGYVKKNINQWIDAGMDDVDIDDEVVSAIESFGAPLDKDMFGEVMEYVVSDLEDSGILTESKYVYQAGRRPVVADGSYLYDPSDYFRSYADDDLFDVEVCGECFFGVSKEDVYRALGRAYDDYEEYAVREFRRYPDGTTSIELVDISDSPSGCRSLIDSLGSGRMASRRAKTRRSSSFADDMDYVSEIPYNQCVICTFGPDEYGRGDWGYDIYLKSGDWISSNTVEFPTEDAAIDDAMDRLDRTGFDSVSQGIVVAGRNAKRSTRKFGLGERTSSFANYDLYEDKLLSLTPEEVEHAEFSDTSFDGSGDVIEARLGGNWSIAVEKLYGGMYEWTVGYWDSDVASGRANSESDAVALAIGSLYNAVSDAIDRSGRVPLGVQRASRKDFMAGYMAARSRKIAATTFVYEVQIGSDWAPDMILEVNRDSDGFYRWDVWDSDQAGYASESADGFDSRNDALADFKSKYDISSLNEIERY